MTLNLYKITGGPESAYIASANQQEALDIYSANFECETEKCSVMFQSEVIVKDEKE